MKVLNEMVVYFCVLGFDILGFGGIIYFLYYFLEYNIYFKYIFESLIVILL